MKKNTQRKNQLLEKIKALKGFQTHLKIYAVVNGIVWLLWLMAAGMSIYAWPAYFTLIWSCVLVLHYVAAEKVFHDGDKKQNKP